MMIKENGKHREEPDMFLDNSPITPYTTKSGMTGLTGTRTKLAGKGSQAILQDGSNINVSLAQSNISRASQIQKPLPL